MSPVYSNGPIQHTIFNSPNCTKFYAELILESADKPGSVMSSHSSRIRVTTNFKRPTQGPYGPYVGLPLAPLFGLAPGGVYLATPCHHACGALLPHRFTLTGRSGGLLSVALSMGSHPPGVTWHPCP